MSRLADVLATCDGAFLQVLDGTGGPRPVSSEAAVQAGNELTELLADRALTPRPKVGGSSTVPAVNVVRGE